MNIYIYIHLFEIKGNRERERKGEKDRELSSNCWFIAQMATMATLLKPGVLSLT